MILIDGTLGLMWLEINSTTDCMDAAWPPFLPLFPSASSPISQLVFS